MNSFSNIFTINILLHLFSVLQKAMTCRNNSLMNLMPGTNIEDRVDFQSIDKNNTNVRYWNPAKNSKILQDMPMRKYNEGATTSILWNAQSSIILNGNRSFTVDWGFTIDSDVSGSFSSPSIINNPRPFHMNIINSLK